MSAREPADGDGAVDRPEEALADLDVPAAEDVTGGALNTYLGEVTGEKQGKFRGG